MSSHMAQVNQVNQVNDDDDATDDDDAAPADDDDDVMLFSVMKEDVDLIASRMDITMQNFCSQRFAWTSSTVIQIHQA